MEDAIYIGSDVAWEGTQSHRAQHDPNQDWLLEWSYLQLPEAQASIAQASVDNTILIETEQERLRCKPDPFAINIPTQDLQMLASFETPTQIRYHEVIMGPPKVLPWGMEYQSLMIYKNSGAVVWNQQ